MYLADRLLPSSSSVFPHLGFSYKKSFLSCVSRGISTSLSNGLILLYQQKFIIDITSTHQLRPAASSRQSRKLLTVLGTGFEMWEPDTTCKKFCEKCRAVSGSRQPFNDMFSLSCVVRAVSCH